MSPSAFIAACTAGRAATRFWKATRLGNAERSTFRWCAQLVTVKRYASATVKRLPKRFVPRELLLDQFVALGEVLGLLLAHLGSRLGVEERGVRLVQLGIDVAQHLLQVIALGGAVGG